VRYQKQVDVSTGLTIELTPRNSRAASQPGGQVELSGSATLPQAGRGTSHHPYHAYLNLFSHTPEVAPRSSRENDSHDDSGPRWEGMDYPPPSRQELRKWLRKRARWEARRFSLRRWSPIHQSRYVDSILDEEYERLLASWNRTRDPHSHSPEEADGGEESGKQGVSVEQAVQEMLLSLSLPLSLSVAFAYENRRHRICLDLDLPTPNSVPREWAYLLPTGEMAVNRKQKPEVRREYSRYVIGVAFFVTGHAFNAVPTARQVLVTGILSPHKRNPERGRRYLYSIVFDRDRFACINTGDDPCNALSLFEYRLQLNDAGNLRNIIPYRGCLPHSE